MNKPTKPNIIIPEAFAVDGIKTDFTAEKLQNGFDRLNPDVLAGDNLNKLIDDTYKGLNYAIAGTDAINLIQEDEVLTVKNGELVSSKVEVGANTDLSNLSTTGQAKFDAKVDLNASNLNIQGKSYVSGLSMPSSRYINLTLGASGSTYTAPANGWIIFGAIGSQNGAYCDLINNSNGMVTSSNNVQLDASVNTNLAVLKNTIVTVTYGYCKTSNLRFIYAEGEV